MDEDNSGTKRKRESLSNMSNKKAAVEDTEEKSPFPTEIRINILEEQKRAILSTLDQQKQQISSLNSKIDVLQDQKLSYQRNLDNVVHFINSVEFDLSSIVSQLDSYDKSISNLRELSAEKDSFYQQLVTSYEVEEKLLEKPHKTLKTLLHKILKIVDHQATAVQQLHQVLNQDSDTKVKHLTQENETLRRENSQLRSNLQTIQKECRELSNNRDAEVEQKIKLETQITKLEDELAILNDNFQVATKKVSKQKMVIDSQSNQIHALQDSLSTISSSNNNATPNSTGSNNSINNVLNHAHTDSPKHDNTEKSADMKGLEDEISDLKFLANSRLDQLNKYQQEKLSLLQELQQLKDTLQRKENLNDDLVKQSDLFKRLYDKYQAVQFELDAVRSQLEKSRQEQYNLSQSHRKDREKLENDEMQRRDKLLTQLREAEYLAQRSKVQLDSANQKLELRNASQPHAKLIDEFKFTISQKDNELKKLKDQCDRYKEDSLKLKNLKEENRKSNEKLTDQIDMKNLEMKDIQNKIAQYKQSIDDFNAQKKLWEEKERELKLLLEVYQSQAKDKRDIRELRLAEKKLQEEVVQLREQLDNQLKQTPEDQLKAMQQKYEEEITTLKKDNFNKLFALEKINKQLKSTVDSQKSELDGYIAEIEVIGKGYEELQDQNQRLLDQLAERDDTITTITSQQIKTSQKESQLNEERIALNEKIQKLEERFSKQADVLKSMETKNRSLQDLVKKQTEENRALSTQMDICKSKYKDMSIELNDLKSQHEKWRSEQEFLRKQNDEMQIALHKQEVRNEKLEEQTETQKRKLDRLTAKASSSADPIVQEELNSLKHKLTCHVCNDKPKSTVIARCFHVFCRPCIQKNLEVRSRKCPACGISFSASDVHNIYL